MPTIGLLSATQNEHFCQQLAAYNAQRDQLLERINECNAEAKRMEKEVERLDDILAAYNAVVKPELEKYERVHK